MGEKKQSLLVLNVFTRLPESGGHFQVCIFNFTFHILHFPKKLLSSRFSYVIREILTIIG